MDVLFTCASESVLYVFPMVKINMHWQARHDCKRDSVAHGKSNGHENGAVRLIGFRHEVTLRIDDEGNIVDVGSIVIAVGTRKRKVGSVPIGVNDGSRLLILGMYSPGVCIVENWST